jgi:hypothetical protein
VPKPKSPSPAAVRLQRLYADANAARRQGARAPLEAIHIALAASHPHEWLLRWNLLEILLDLGLSNDPLIPQLERRLRELEDHYGGRHPIALGLDYLGARRSSALRQAAVPTD